MKQTKKQIEANLRNKLAKEYNNKIESYKNKIVKIYNELNIANNKTKELEDSNLELKEKISQYEDWIDRLQEFCNMNKEDRKFAINEFRDKKVLEKCNNDFKFWFDTIKLFNF